MYCRNQETGERIVRTRDGLGFGVDESWRNPREVIRWSQIEEIAREVPADVRDELVEFRARWRAHQSAYPRFTASAAAVWCGPVIPGEPLTPRQQAYVREHEEFEASGVLPAWEQKKTALESERLGLHDRALRAGSVEEQPGDLLELLEDQQLGRPAEAPGFPTARGRAHMPAHQVEPCATADFSVATEAQRARERVRRRLRPGRRDRRGRSGGERVPRNRGGQRGGLRRGCRGGRRAAVVNRDSDAASGRPSLGVTGTSVRTRRPIR